MRDKNNKRIGQMKVVIPLQTVLVAFLLLGISVLLTIIFKEKKINVESFVESRDTDIQLQACPSGTQSFTQNGNTFCCDGDLQNGMCNGRTVCSLSSNSQQMPSCVTSVSYTHLTLPTILRV